MSNGKDHERSLSTSTLDQTELTCLSMDQGGGDQADDIFKCTFLRVSITKLPRLLCTFISWGLTYDDANVF